MITRVLKLIRDKKSLPRDDREDVWHVKEAPAWALISMLLVNKLHEEVQEVAGNLKDPFEYADVLEALQSLAEVHGVDWGHILECQEVKRATSGGLRCGFVYVGLDHPPS